MRDQCEVFEENLLIKSKDLEVAFCFIHFDLVLIFFQTLMAFISKMNFKSIAQFKKVSP